VIGAFRRLVPPTIRTFLSKIGGRKGFFPRTVTLSDFARRPIRFRVSSEMERSRIVSFGSEEEFLRHFLGEVRVGDVVFDVGACLGIYAIPAALAGARVVAFEPDPSFRAALRDNVELNGLTGLIRIIDWAVAEAKGTTTLFTDGTTGPSPSLAQVGERGAVVVGKDSLDNAIGRGDLPVPDLVKMDIEGAEILALRGMTALLAAPRAPRRLFVELHPAFLPGFGSCVAECASMLDSLGYVAVSTHLRAEQLHCVYARAADGGTGTRDARK